MKKLPPQILDATILDAIRSPEIFARWFRDLVTWAAWFCFLKVLFGLLLDPEELELFRRCTGRDQPPAGGYLEAWLCCGRRAGKSLILALVAVFLACFRDWSPYLSPGERGTIMVIAADRKQARVIHRYCRALSIQVPALKALVERDVAEAIDLKNGVTIEILTASFRTLRGYTLIAALCDEIAYWRSDTTVNPDSEIVGAIRPAMATIPRAMMLCASSPYARKGVLYQAHQKHYAKPTPVLFWKAPTRVMNPTVPQSVIDEAYEDDPASAAAEYGTEFRSDIESFIAREVVESLVVPGRHEIPPIVGVSYSAFTDPAGGSGGDSFTLAIAHQDSETKRGILDAIREVRPPFSPESAIEDLAALLKAYRCHKVVGDRWGGEFPREAFRKLGVEYAIAEKPKSDLYKEALPVLNSGRAELLDNPRLIAQIVGLERRTARGGRDSIDHGSGNSHDDIANVALAVLVQVTGEANGLDVWIRCGRDDPPAPAPAAPVPEVIMPDQLNSHAPPGSAEFRRLAARRLARPMSAIIKAGDATIRVRSPKDVYLQLANDGLPPVLIAQGVTEIPAHLADHWWLKVHGVQVINGAET